MEKEIENIIRARLVIENKDSVKYAVNDIIKLLNDKYYTLEDIEKAINYGSHLEAGNIDMDFKNYSSPGEQFVRTKLNR